MLTAVTDDPDTESVIQRLDWLNVVVQARHQHVLGPEGGATSWPTSTTRTRIAERQGHQLRQWPTAADRYLPVPVTAFCQSRKRAFATNTQVFSFTFYDPVQPPPLFGPKWPKKIRPNWLEGMETHQAST